MAGNILKLLSVRGLAQYFDVRRVFLVDGEMYVWVNVGRGCTDIAIGYVNSFLAM